MTMKKFQNYTNSELNLKMKSLENEYEANKHKILELISEMQKLDIDYAEAKREIENRRLAQCA